MIEMFELLDNLVENKVICSYKLESDNWDGYNLRIVYMLNDVKLNLKLILKEEWLDTNRIKFVIKGEMVKAYGRYLDDRMESK